MATQVNVIEILSKRHLLATLIAVLFFALNDKFISSLQSELNHWLWLLVLTFTLGALISPFLVFPLIVAIFAADSHFTIPTKQGNMGEVFANAAVVLLCIFLVFVFYNLNFVNPFFIFAFTSFTCILAFV